MALDRRTEKENRRLHRRALKLENILCKCGGTCKFQGDVGQVDEWKCEKCGKVYALMRQEDT